MICYIITNKDHSNQEYIDWKTDKCVKSCEDMGYTYELIYGPTPGSKLLSVFNSIYNTDGTTGLHCCALAHLFIQREIRKGRKKNGIIMEFDAEWINPLDFILREDVMTSVEGGWGGAGYYIPVSLLPLLLEEQKYQGLLHHADAVMQKKKDKPWLKPYSPRFEQEYDVFRLPYNHYIKVDMETNMSIRRGHTRTKSNKGKTIKELKN